MSLSKRGRVVAGLVSVLFALLCDAVIAAEPDPALQQAIRDAAAQQRPPLLARDQLSRQPAVGDVRLSPDGRRLAFVRRAGLLADVLVQTIADGAEIRVVAAARDVEIAWSADGRRLWLSDQYGLSAFDSASGGSKRLHRWDRARAQRLWKVPEHAAQFAVIHEKAWQDGSERHRYLLIDADGTTRRLHEAALPLRDLLLTASGALAYTAAYAGPQYDTVIRQHRADSVRELLRCTGIETCMLAGYDAAQPTLWLLSQHGSDLLALQRWQPGHGWDVVHRDPAGIADADALLWDHRRATWRAIGYYGARRHWHGNGSAIAAQLRALQQRLDGASLQLSTSSDGLLWLVRAQRSEWARDRHYLYRADADTLRPLFAADAAAADAPPPARLTPAHAISWQARDGMRLHGYVYLPRGVVPAQAPLIAWLHGGPIGRLDDQYHPGIQLLANRGYAVFVPNFRASTGYGLAYVRAAQGDVGNGRVLHDIIDGLDFLLARGIGDRDKQAVVGHSFGGYASLLAVSHHPQRFRFAFAAAPPIDYGWMKQWQADHDHDGLRAGGPPLAVQFAQYGFAFEDAGWRQRMQRESPLAALPQVQAALHLWAGARDDRVPLNSIVHYATAAAGAGKTVRLLIDPAAGHAPSTPLSSDAWLYMLEQAADRAFGGGSTPPTSELQAFIQRQLRVDTVVQTRPAVP